MVYEEEDSSRLLEESLEPAAIRSHETGISASWNSKHHNALKIVLSIAFIALILDSGNYIAEAPTTAVLESTVCSKYHSLFVSSIDGTTGTDDLCKSEPVQSDLAFLVGWKDTFELIPGVLLAVPYGILADRVGRKKIWLLCLTGLFLTDGWTRLVLWFSDIFPVRMVWLSGLWQLIGGGPATSDALTTVIIAEVCPPEKRTVAFALIQVSKLTSEFLIIPVGAALMTIDPWIPLCLSSTITFLSILLAAILVPETLTTNSKAGASSDETDETSSLLPGAARDENAPTDDSGRLNPLNRLRSTLQWMSHNLGVVLIAFACFAGVLGRQSAQFLLQYATKRFHWSYAKASYLISLRSFVNLGVVLFLTSPLPEMTRVRLSLDPMTSDKRITQLSALFLVLGHFTIFTAAAPMLLAIGQAVSALGLASSVTARSLVGSLVDQRHLGTAYTAIAVMIYAGALVGGPLFAGCFHWGLLLGDFWMGLPFLVSTGIFILMLLAVSLVKVKPRTEETL